MLRQGLCAHSVFNINQSLSLFSSQQNSAPCHEAGRRPILNRQPTVSPDPGKSDEVQVVPRSGDDLPLAGLLNKLCYPVTFAAKPLVLGMKLYS